MSVSFSRLGKFSLSPFSFWGPYNLNVILFSVVPVISLLFYFILFFFFLLLCLGCASTLSSRSLVAFSESCRVLLTPSCIFLVQVLFSSLYSSSWSLLWTLYQTTTYFFFIKIFLGFHPFWEARTSVSLFCLALCIWFYILGKTTASPIFEGGTCIRDEPYCLTLPKFLSLELLWLSKKPDFFL